MAEWGGQARTRPSGRRRHWKLPDMISGVRHRFRDKMRSKSPEFYGGRDPGLDSDAGSNLSSSYRYNGGGTLPRASSMMSTDYGFNPMDWGAGAGYPGPPAPPIDLTNRVPRPPPHASDLSSRGSRSATSSNSSQPSRLPAPPPPLRTLSTSYEASTTSGDYSPPPPPLYPPPNLGASGRAASVSVLSQPSQPSLQRGKSVRFGENRISIFMQDSTQALEECVRLALSYAEEEKKTRGDYYSDSEAVSLTRRMHREPEGSNSSRSRSFYSDSEERPERESNRGGHASVPLGPAAHSSHRQHSFGQSVTSLERLERLEKIRAEARHRKKKSAQINEIFSFIDKVLSGCDSGCSDECCPLAREAARAANQGSYSASHNHAYPATGLTPRLSKKRTSNSDVNNCGLGYESDSDCDTSGSNCSTLARPRGRPHRGRLRPGEASTSLVKATRTTEDVFAQIIICSELNKQSLGMPRYGHLHQKISQTVCNAIFLCKVCLSSASYLDGI